VTPDGTAVSLDVVGLTGSNSSRISGIAVDADDTLYVASNNASQTPLNAIGERTRDGRIHLLTPSRINGPSGLAVDIGGMVYVANQHDGTISRISPDGTISTFAANLHRPSGLAFDTSGILYVADYASNSIKKITPDGNVSLFASSLINGPNAITFDKLGNLYVSNVGSNLITRVTPTGLSSIYSSSDAIDGPLGLTFGPNGNLFVTDFGQDRVVIITPDGSVLPDNGTGVHAQGITTTPDGTIYAINYSAVTSITSDGSAVSPPLSGFEEGLFVLTSDATGNLYLANTNRNAIEKLAVAPSPLVAAILPGARSVQQGSVATVFATIINTGSLPLGNCGISLPAQDQATKSLAFQTTDPSTNVAIGRSNQFVSIAAHGQQSYVLAITAPNDSVGQPFIFTCDGVQPVANLSGINTLDLFVRSNPIPDIIPIAVTPSHDGIAAIPHGQAAAFAVAGVNIGGTATVTIDTTTGSAGLPLNLTICETNPANGQCFAPPVFSLQRAFPANGPPATFSVFLTASTAIPLAPQASRVYVRFTDQKDGTSASTSVAVMAK
jgi:sugar lactone lactonase YvrE